MISNKEAEVLRMRFGLNESSPMTLKDIGELMGVTRERVRQIESKALDKLRKNPEVMKLKDFLDD